MPRTVARGGPGRAASGAGHSRAHGRAGHYNVKGAFQSEKPNSFIFRHSVTVLMFSARAAWRRFPW